MVQTKGERLSERVFISSRAKAPLEALKAAIRSAEMTILELDERVGKSVDVATQAAIRNSDYVLVVWDTPRLPRSVLFEAGLAVGVGANVALLDARTRRDSRDDLIVETFLSVPRLHGRLADVEGLTRELLALRHVNFRNASSSTHIFAETDWPVRPSAAPGGSEFEERVLRVLNQLDISVLQVRSDRLSRIPDWEAVVPNLLAPFNPVFIELAGRKAHLERKRTQVREALIRRGAHICALITLDPVETDVLTDRDTAIVEISLEQLERAPHELGLLLRTARNQLVHGVG